MYEQQDFGELFPFSKKLMIHLEETGPQNVLQLHVASSFKRYYLLQLKTSGHYTRTL
jgi:hypothetical protein